MLRIPRGIYREIQTVSSFKRLLAVLKEGVICIMEGSYVTPSYFLFSYAPTKIACYICTKYYYNKYTKPLNEFKKRVSIKDMEILKEANWSNIHSLSDTEENYSKIKNNLCKSEAIKIILKYLLNSKNKIAMNLVDINEDVYYMCPLVSKNKEDNKEFNCCLAILMNREFNTKGYFETKNIVKFQEEIKRTLFNDKIVFEAV